MSDLDDILSSGGEPVSPPAPETPQAEAQQPEANQTVAETPQSEEATDEQKMVPVAALQAERQKSRKYTEHLAQVEKELAEQRQQFSQLQQWLLAQQQAQQPKPQVPDFWEAPETAIDYRVQQEVAPIKSLLQKQREEFSMLQAVDKHGQEIVDAAFSEMRSRMASDPYGVKPDYDRIMSSPHPYGALVDWHRKQQALAEIGSDPAAYREKLKAELLAELQQQAPAAPSAPSLNLPSNFAAARNVGARSGPNWSGPAPINDIFDRARKAG
jgi:hypothetical protein